MTTNIPSVYHTPSGRGAAHPKPLRVGFKAIRQGKRTKPESGATDECPVGGPGRKKKATLVVETVPVGALRAQALPQLGDSPLDDSHVVRWALERAWLRPGIEPHRVQREALDFAVRRHRLTGFGTFFHHKFGCGKSLTMLLAAFATCARVGSQQPGQPNIILWVSPAGIISSLIKDLDKLTRLRILNASDPLPSATSTEPVDVVAMVGNGLRRRLIREQLLFAPRADTSSAHTIVAVTTPLSLLHDIDELRSLASRGRGQIACTVIDEAHRAREETTQLPILLRTEDMLGVRIMGSGSTLVNRPSDILCQAHILFRGTEPAPDAQGVISEFLQHAVHAPDSTALQEVLHESSRPALIVEHVTVPPLPRERQGHDERWKGAEQAYWDRNEHVPSGFRRKRTTHILAQILGARTWSEGVGHLTPTRAVFLHHEASRLIALQQHCAGGSGAGRGPVAWEPHDESSADESSPGASPGAVSEGGEIGSSDEDTMGVAGGDASAAVLLSPPTRAMNRCDVCGQSAPSHKLKRYGCAVHCYCGTCIGSPSNEVRIAPCAFGCNPAARHARLTLPAVREAVVTSKFRSLLDILARVSREAATLAPRTKGSAARDKILVYSPFVTSLLMVQLGLRLENIGFEMYVGSMSAAQRSDALEHFEHDDSVRVMLLQEVAGGEGINFQHTCHTAVLFGTGWTQAGVDQQIGRIDRPGQQYAPRVYFLEMQDSCEMRMARVRAHKATLAQQVSAVVRGNRNPDNLRLLFDNSV